MQTAWSVHSGSSEDKEPVAAERSVVPDTQHAGRVGVAEARREANAFYCQATLFLLTLVNSVHGRHNSDPLAVLWINDDGEHSLHRLGVAQPVRGGDPNGDGRDDVEGHAPVSAHLPGLYYVLIIAAFLLGVVLHRHAEKRCPS